MADKEFYLILAPGSVVAAPADATEEQVRDAAYEVALITGKPPIVIVTDDIGYHLQVRHLMAEDVIRERSMN